MDVVLLVAGALATWRLALMIAVEDGPYDVFQRLREWAGARRHPDGTEEYDNTFAKLLSCVWCVSVWVGAAATVIIWPEDWRLWLLLPFAFSAVAVGVEAWRTRK